MRTPSGHEVYAMGAEYPNAAALYEAAKMVRDAGFKRWDVFSPFPIHGMDEAMGLGKSWLSGWVLFGGVSGLLTAVLVEFGPSWGLYPLIVHGKPYDWRTVPAFFPIMFYMRVSLTCVIAWPPLMDSSVTSRGGYEVYIIEFTGKRLVRYFIVSL